MAFNLIKEHKTLENVVEIINKGGKYTLPEDWPYKDARLLFLEPDVRSADDEQCDFKWDAPDVDGLVKFLVEEKGFNEDRVRSGAARLQKSTKSTQQQRLEGFFKPMAKTEEQKQNLKKKTEAKLAEAKKKAKEDQKAKKELKSKPRGTA